MNTKADVLSVTDEAIPLIESSMRFSEDDPTGCAQRMREARAAVSELIAYHADSTSLRVAVDLF